MTLDYKILGQVYYGPEINETPEIPGTSGYYTYTTGSVKNRLIASADFNSGSAYSDDGIVWNSTVMPFEASAIVNGNNRFVAIGYSGQAAYSDDGITWTVTNMASSDYWLSLLYGNNTFVALAYNSNQAAYSTDGITWTNITLPISGMWVPFIYEGNKFVAVSYGQNSSISSSNGITWTIGTLPSANDWNRIVYGDGKFLVTAGQSGGAAAYSTDGINWTATNTPNVSLHTLVYGGGKFIGAVYSGSPTGVYYSTDGITWNTSSMPIALVYGLVYADNKFVATGISNQAAYSLDGITWTATSMPSDKNWSALIYAGDKFFVFNVNPVSSSNEAAYSLDGITWTATTMPSLAFWRHLAYGQISTLSEVQISIGGQGIPGSYVEIIEPQVVYTVPSGTQTTITSIFATNHDSVERTFDLAIVPAGETLSLKHHIRWDMPVSATDFDLINAKITMSAGDKIFVFPSTINKVGFTLFGVEKS